MRLCLMSNILRPILIRRPSQVSEVDNSPTQIRRVLSSCANPTSRIRTGREGVFPDRQTEVSVHGTPPRRHSAWVCASGAAGGRRQECRRSLAARRFIPHQLSRARVRLRSELQPIELVDRADDLAAVAVVDARGVREV